jgi:hypothetical protein
MGVETSAQKIGCFPEIRAGSALRFEIGFDFRGPIAGQNGEDPAHIFALSLVLPPVKN